MKQTSKKTKRGNNGPRNHVFTLEVFLLEGPMSERFMKKNKVVSRTIRMKGDQTLQALHEAIFSAFDRWDEHAYEFQVGGKGPMDPKARRYILPGFETAMSGDDGQAGKVTETTLADIGLDKGAGFGYWFDFGDDWWHQINVVDIANFAEGAYPRVGASPPQYIDDDEDDRSHARHGVTD